MFRDFWEDIGSKVLKIWWCTILTISLGLSLFDGTIQKNLAVMSNITAWMVIQNLVVILVAVAVFIGLAKLHPVFKWSWLLLLKSREDKAKSGTNIFLLPIYMKYFSFVFVALLMVNLPSLAMIEEKWFRAGTKDWLEGLYMSFLFGISHCLVGVPIGVGVAIALAGLWYTHQYFIGGVELSALHHTTYNLIIISVVFVSLVLIHIRDLRERKT